jgi:hypothetical protein
MHSAPLSAGLPYSVSADSASASGAKRQRRRTPCSLLPRTTRESLRGARADACLRPGEAGAPRALPPVAPVAQSRSPALADIIGARRVRTAAMISSGSMPWR